MGIKEDSRLVPPAGGCEVMLRGIKCRWRAVQVLGGTWHCTVCADRYRQRLVLARARRLQKSRAKRE